MVFPLRRPAEKGSDGEVCGAAAVQPGSGRRGLLAQPCLLSGCACRWDAHEGRQPTGRGIWELLCCPLGVRAKPRAEKISACVEPLAQIVLLFGPSGESVSKCSEHLFLYRIPEWWGLEGTFVGHPVQPSC